jgi:hypothetical protein
LIPLVAALICLVGGAIVVMLGDHARRSVTSQFSGDWSVEYQGRSNGVIALLPSGRIDSHDDYHGRWTQQDGMVHLKFWEKPRTPLGYLNPRNLFPQADEYVLAPSFDPASHRYILRNENTTLRRVP